MTNQDLPTATPVKNCNRRCSRITSAFRNENARTTYRESLGYTVGMKNKFVDGFNHLFGRHGFDYDQINKDLYLGTNRCCQFGFAKELLAKNVRVDISLEEERVDAPRGVDYFIWLPTVDGQAPSPDKLALGVQSLEFFAERKLKVYIHCKNGHGRAPTLYAAYLLKQGMMMEAAIASIKARRPTIHLTEAQRKALQIFQKTISPLPKR